jgi:tripartite ATP-independent transporter DctP family solute receptor
MKRAWGVSALAMLLAMGLGPGRALGAEMTLKWGSTLAPDHPNNVGARKAIEVIEGKTAGRIKIQFFPASQLGSTQEMLEAMIAGNQEMQLENPSVLSQFVARVGILTAPYIVRDREHLYKVLQAPVGKELLNELVTRRGLRPTGAWSYGTRHTTTAKRAIRRVEDLKGLKIRIPNVPITLEYLKAAGASPVPMAFPEVYLALQTGVVDGQENPLPTIWTSKFYEVQKYLALTGHMIDVMFPLITERVWNRLSAADQQVFLEAMRIGGQESDRISDQMERDLVEKIRQHGVTVTTPEREGFAAAAEVAYKRFEGVWGKGLVEQIRAVR